MNKLERGSLGASCFQRENDGIS